MGQGPRQVPAEQVDYDHPPECPLPVQHLPLHLSRPVIRLLKTLLWTLLVGGALVAGFGVWWLNQPIAWPETVTAEAPQEVSIEPGSSARAVAQAVTQAGASTSSTLLYAWFRLSGRARSIKAGYYEFGPGTTPRDLLDKMVRGDQALLSFTLVEGWNIREVLQAVRSSPDLVQDIEGVSTADLMARIGLPGQHPEGRFFPDTYRMVKHTPASTVLRLAAQAMDERLAQAWAQRAEGTPLRSAQDALILASIVEKETGLDSDRALVGGVFNNRLRIGMRLQTDPTIIYGLGERFDGNLRRNHLITDAPYNTYTRAGLPPTPICMPGWNSLLAAVRPASTKALYFVARGDGSSQFSATLQEHNAAVQRYQLRR
jgi:UPF0755 protein